MAKKYDDIGGVWRTIGGRRVFIKDGQSLSEAMIASGKFKNLRSDYRKAKEEEKEKTSVEEKSDFYNKLSLEEKKKYDDYLEKGYTPSDIENTLMFKTQEETMEEHGIKFASEEETKGLQNKANKVAKDLKETKEEIWEKQPDGTFLANKDAMKKQYEENHKNYDAKIKQFAEDRKNMTNGDWEGMLMAYEKQNADGTYKSLQDIMDDVDKYEKEKGKDYSGLDYNKDMMGAYNELKDGKINYEEYKEKTDKMMDKYYEDKERVALEHKDYSYDYSKETLKKMSDEDLDGVIAKKQELVDEYTNKYNQDLTYDQRTTRNKQDTLWDKGMKTKYEQGLMEAQEEKFNRQTSKNANNSGDFVSQSTNPLYPDTTYTQEQLKRMEDAGVKPMENTYSGRGWKGVNTDKHLSTSEQAKAITSAMKEKYPDVKIARKI